MGGRDRYDAGMLVVATAAAPLDESLARLEVSRRTDGREINRRVTRLEPVQELVRPPARVRATGLADQRRHLVGYFVRTSPRRPAAIAESFPPALIESVQPLVARFPTDAVPRTQLGHRVQRQPVIANEPLALLHGCRLQPGHRSTSQSIPSVVGVTHVPGLFCYQCTRFVPTCCLTSACSRPRRCDDEPRRLKPDVRSRCDRR